MDTNSDKRKAYLNLMAGYSYDEYLEFKSQGLIVSELDYEEGFVYVKDNVENYGIRISFADERSFNSTDIEKYIVDKSKTVYVLMNSQNVKIHTYLMEQGFTDMYMCYEMMNHEIPETQELLPVEPYQEDRFDDYIRVLSSFAPMREALNLEPYDWYAENLGEAKKKFEKHASDSNFYSYSQDGQIVAVIMMDKNEIDTIAVHKAYQKQGIGEKLLRTGMEILRHRGMESQVLSVMAINEKAIELYRKVGFQVNCGMTVLVKEKSE